MWLTIVSKHAGDSTRGMKSHGKRVSYVPIAQKQLCNKLADMRKMTVILNDPRHNTRGKEKEAIRNISEALPWKMLS